MNLNTSSYPDMLLDTSIEQESKLILNYTSKTSDLVDKMITIKSANSNVVKEALTS